LDKPITLEGIGGGVQIHQQGIIKYTTIDDEGNPMVFKVPGYYTPELKQCLFSPQILFMTDKPSASLFLSGTQAKLTTPGHTLTLSLDTNTRLYYMPTYSQMFKRLLMNWFTTCN
jgi:hypothetical protein